MLYRQATSATDRDREEYIRQTITFLRESARYYGDDKVSVDPALVSRVLDGWYRAVVAQESIVGGPGAGAVLTGELEATYTAAVETLLRRAAARTNVPLSELYRINRGRIPPWAWQEPHHMIHGIATPIPAGREADPISGAVEVAAHGVSVSVLPDAQDPALADRAKTRISLRLQAPDFSWEARGRDHVVTAVDALPVATATIQTFYGQGIGPDTRSGYGRGTTPEDLAGAAADPRSRTVAFHEGQHGMDYIEFLRTHEPPAFEGHVGMTVPAFERATRQWMRAWQAYKDQADAFSLSRTDCVGVTIDEWEQERAVGKRVELVCPRQPRR